MKNRNTEKFIAWSEALYATEKFIAWSKALYATENPARVLEIGRKRPETVDSRG